MAQVVLEKDLRGHPVHLLPGRAGRKPPQGLVGSQCLFVEPHRDCRAGRELRGKGPDPRGERALDSLGGPGKAEENESDFVLRAELQDLPGRPLVAPPLERFAGGGERPGLIRGRKPDPFLPEVDRQNALGKRVAGVRVEGVRSKTGVRYQVSGARLDPDPDLSSLTPGTGYLTPAFPLTPAT